MWLEEGVLTAGGMDKGKSEELGLNKVICHNTFTEYHQTLKPIGTYKLCFSEK